MSELIGYNAELSPEEIKQARQIVAWEELKETVQERQNLAARLDYKADGALYDELGKLDKKIVALALEVFSKK
jgi:uncharacterized coiled-coil protein SlyX